MSSETLSNIQSTACFTQAFTPLAKHEIRTEDGLQYSSSGSSGFLSIDEASLMKCIESDFLAYEPQIVALQARQEELAGTKRSSQAFDDPYSSNSQLRASPSLTERALLNQVESDLQTAVNEVTLLLEQQSRRVEELKSEVTLAALIDTPSPVRLNVEYPQTQSAFLSPLSNHLDTTNCSLASALTPMSLSPLSRSVSSISELSISPNLIQCPDAPSLICFLSTQSFSMHYRACCATDACSPSTTLAMFSSLAIRHLHGLRLFPVLFIST